MNEETGTTSRQELETRWERCRHLLQRVVPEAGGLMAFSRLNVYYLSGTFANGFFWLPLEGEPVLACRRGAERALIESPLREIRGFRSFRDLAALLADAGAPLADTVAAETDGLSWTLGRSLSLRLPDVNFLPGDRVLAMARAIKSALELATLREAGRRHDECLRRLLPPLIAPGMSERDVAVRLWEVFFSRGHQGMLRMQNQGEEIFLGHVSAGIDSLYASVFNGPVGVRGVHPAVPHMGSEQILWEKGQPLTLDVGFGLEGYCTDKTQVYWAGPPDSIPERVREAHEACVEIQARLAERLRPGTPASELCRAAFRLAEKTGWSEGFMGLGGNRVPFVGHGIGLAIDEYPPLAEGFDDPVEEGMVLALEPKIALPGVGMVGVENTFEVTPEGGLCLTGNDYGIICVG